MAGNGLHLEANFENLGPSWNLQSTQLQSVVLYWQKSAKIPVRFQYFKSYGRLYQPMYEHFRHSSLYRNRPIRVLEFIITTAYRLRKLGLFPTSVIFQAFTLLNSLAVPVNWSVLPSKLEHGFVEFLGSEQSSTPWSWLKLEKKNKFRLKQASCS